MSHCFAPFKSLCVKNDGQGSVCCTSKDLFDVADWTKAFDSDYMKTLREETPVGKPSGCSTCFTSAANKIPNRKEYFDNLLTHDTRVEIETIEVNLTNYCNYSCVMCSSEFSTQWRNLGDKRVQPYKLTEKSIDEIIRLVETHPVKQIDIQGGEPFYIPETLTLVEKLVDVGYRGELLLVTNASRVDNAELIKYLRMLNTVITVSIDTVDADLYKIIRSPSVPFSTVVENIGKLKWCSNKLFLNACIMNLNAYTFGNLNEFSLKTVESEIHTNWVIVPASLEVHVLNDRRKDSTLETLSKANYKGAEHQKLMDLVSKPVKQKRLDEFETYFDWFCRSKSIDKSLWNLL